MQHALSRFALLFLTLVAYLSAGIITGRVIDAATGEPVINANIIVDRLNTGTATDFNGYFTIPDLPNKKLTFFISHIAYEDKRLPIEADCSDLLIIKLSETFFQLSEVVVTGTRTEKIHQNVPVTTEIISRKDIDDSGTLDLGELLNQRAGVAVTSSVEGGQVVNLMGIDSRYILILVDGQPITGKFNNRVSLEQVPTSIIDKIEIIKGPNSSLYGSEAMGGVINVITSKQITGIEFSIRTRYSGDYAHYDVLKGRALVDSVWVDSTEKEFQGITDGPKFNIQTNMGYGSQNFSDRFNLDFTFTRPNDVAPHISVDQISKISLGNDLTYKPSSKTKLHTKFDTYQSKEESHSEAMDAVTIVKRNNLIGDVSYRPFQELEIQAVSRWSDYHRLYNQDRPWGTVVGRDTTKADDLELELISIYASGSTTFNLGFEQGITGYEGKRLNKDRQSLSSTSIYGQIEFKPLDRLTVVLGTRRDDNNEISPVISPRLAAMVAITDRWKLRTAYGRGYRQPSFMERYIAWFHEGIGYGIIGNPDLQPERSIGGNIGVEYYHPGAYHVSLMVYSTKFNDMIDDYVYDGDDNPFNAVAFSYRNIAEVNYMGIEFQNRWKISDKWLASWGYNFVDNRDARTDSLIANTQPHTANFRISFQTKNGKLSSSLKAKLVGPYIPEDFDTDEDDFVRATKKRATFGLFDLGVKYSITNNLKITGGCQNLLNYIDERYGPFIGRRVYLELTAEFN